MPAWMEIVFFNAIGATILAAIVWLIARRIQRAAVVHTLWLIVLLKLVSPPVFEVGFLPSFAGVGMRPGIDAHLDGAAFEAQSEQAPSQAHSQAGRFLPGTLQQTPAGGSGATAISSQDQNSVPLDVASSKQTLAPARTTPLQSRVRMFLSWFSVAAAAGTLLLLGLSIARLVRFRRGLREAPEAPPELQERTAALSRSLGIKRAPHIRIVPDRIPPSLRPGPGACEILLPAALLEKLSEDECDTLLAHELAHLRRRDHWVRPFELLVVALYWWHPVAWWARRQLRIAEEQACDEWVVGNLAKRPRVYAESLLKTVEFLALRDRDHAVPLLATGVTGTARLKERVTMILKKKMPEPLSKRVRPFVYAAMLLALLVSPAWVAKPQEKGGREAEEAYRQEMLQMEQERLALQKQLQELESRRARVRLGIEEKQMQRQIETLREEIAALEKAGKKDEAEELRHRIAAMERENALHRRQVEFEQGYAEKRMRMEHELQELVLQRELAESKGDLKRAEELIQQSFELEQELRRLELEVMEAELERSRARFEHEKATLEELEP